MKLNAKTNLKLFEIQLVNFLLKADKLWYSLRIISWTTLVQLMDYLPYRQTNIDITITYHLIISLDKCVQIFSEYIS